MNMLLFVDVIGGFTQTQGTENGCIELEEKLNAEVDAYSRLAVRVKFNPWNATWRHVARNRYLTAKRYPRTIVKHVVCPYSWGVGHGLVQFAKHLDRFGMKIDTAVLCDGIYRHWWKKWRSLFGGYRIVLPENVLAYHGFYQRKSRPMGARPIGNARELSWTELGVEHIEADNSDIWHQTCMNVIRDMLQPVSTTCIPSGAPESVATIRRKKNGQT